MRPLFDNRSLIDWLASKDPEQPYNYMHGSCCLISQYIHYRGFPCAVVDSHSVYLEGGRYGSMRILPPLWNEIAQTKPWTFGAALARAREELGPGGYRLEGTEATVIIVDELL